ncbi:MAG TPA: hypothetical protein VLA72_03385 [Anaerolineales bacterium]|nr:hypothetical protein [Anaerolineales bacterium]
MKKNIASQLGFWASVLIAIGTGIYFLTLIYHFSTAGIVNPNTPIVQLIGGIDTFISLPLFVMLFIAIRYVHEGEKEILGSLGVSFIILFAATVSINRFVQLTVIQPSMPDVPADLSRFLPYATGSVMYALEWLGWGFFSSLAFVFVAPLFSASRRNRTIRWLFILYSIFSFTGLIGFVTNTPIAFTAIIAWGPITLVLTILLAIYFRHINTQSA